MISQDIKRDRARIKGRIKIPKKQALPLIIEDEAVEFIGSPFPEEGEERTLAGMMEPSAEDDGKQPDRKAAVPGEGIVSDSAGLQEEYRAQGLLYEIAEELYIREKTASELEALAKPPFRKVFDSNDTAALDREAVRRTKRLIERAGENVPAPTFLPEATYEENARPVGLAQALGAELLFIIPVIGIAAAFVFALNPRVNKNLRTFSRAFLIIAGLLLSASAVFLAGKLL